MNLGTHKKIKEKKAHQTLLISVLLFQSLLMFIQIHTHTKQLREAFKKIFHKYNMPQKT